MGGFRKTIANISLLVALAAVTVSAADDGLKITDVTVFKDGHALVLTQGAVAVEDGWFHTREVPVPVLGTFWSFVTEEESHIKYVKAGMAEKIDRKPCLSIDEMIRANTGKRVVLYEKKPEQDPEPHRGVLFGLLDEDSDSVDRSGASFVMLKSEDGVLLLDREKLDGRLIFEDDPVTQTDFPKSVREISLRIEENGQPADGEKEIGFVYLQRGIRWIPSYRVQLGDNGTAEMGLQGTLINELADMEDVTLRFVVGVPNFEMQSKRSPLALWDGALNLGAYFGSRGTALMSQVSNTIASNFQQASGRAAPGELVLPDSDLSNAGRKEDLFLYKEPGISLKKGERAIVSLLRVTVPYEDLYTWDIPPVPPAEAWPKYGDNQHREFRDALTKAKPMHVIRLKNDGDEPWTTGPAMIFKDGAPLGQQMLKYTSVNNEVDLGVTVATDLHTAHENVEVRRRNQKIGDAEYIRIYLRGTLTVTNFKSKEAAVRITRNLRGSATKATGRGKIVRLDVSRDPTFQRWQADWTRRTKENPATRIAWDATIPAGESKTFDYDWNYLLKR